jgi:hypothetical protein
VGESRPNVKNFPSVPELTLNASSVPLRRWMEGRRPRPELRPLLFLNTLRSIKEAVPDDAPSAALGECPCRPPLCATAIHLYRDTLAASISMPTVERHESGPAIHFAHTAIEILLISANDNQYPPHFGRHSGAVG